MNKHRDRFAHLSGFTLLEMVVVIAITGVLAAMIGVFIQAPVRAYVDTERRGRLTEAADSSLRRMARDIRTALPNSVRVNTNAGGDTFLEFIPTIGGGRYRVFPTAAGTGNALDFSASDVSFDVTGPVPAYAAGDSVVIFNLGPGSAADAYAGNNRVAVTSANANAALFSTDAAAHTVTFAATMFPQPSPAARFHMVQTPVTYQCNMATGQILRYRNYGWSAAQQLPPAGATIDVLADGVSACTIAYDPVITRTRTGLVTLWLVLTESGENVQLVHQMHVQNMP